MTLLEKPYGSVNDLHYFVAHAMISISFSTKELMKPCMTLNLWIDIKHKAYWRCNMTPADSLITYGNKDFELYYI